MSNYIFMNAFKTLRDKIMALFNRYNVSEIYGIDTNTISSSMAEHIKLWSSMMQGSAPWNDENESSGVISAIAGALSDPVSEEIEVESNNERLADVMKQLNERASDLVQNAVLMGSSVVRPVYSNGKMQFEIIKLGDYLPTSYDFDGTLTGALLLKEFSENKKKFLLIEKHKYENKSHSVHLELYEVSNGKYIRVPLTACSQTETLTESYQWENVDCPFIVEIRNREDNKIDGSNIPVAIYNGRENLIKDADEQYTRLKWEMEGGELKVFADDDLFRKFKKDGADGRPIIPDHLRKLFIKLNGNGIGEEKITTFAPTLRTDAQIAAFNQILRRIETAFNIGKGTLSDMEAVNQTATQYTGGKTVLYTKVDKLESELEQKYKQLAYIFAYMLSAYEGIPFDAEIAVTFNDVTRKNPQLMKQEDRTDVLNGIMNKYEYRMKYYGEDEATAKANTPEDATPTASLNNWFE